MLSPDFLKRISAAASGPVCSYPRPRLGLALDGFPTLSTATFEPELSRFSSA